MKKEMGGSEKEMFAGERGPIHVSTWSLFLTTLPLVMIAAICGMWMDSLQSLATSILTSCLRTFLQLSLLGIVLRPIFVASNKFFVFGHAMFMILLASYESSARTKYTYEGQFYGILGSMMLNTVWVGLFCFLGILRLQPFWNPPFMQGPHPF